MTTATTIDKQSKPKSHKQLMKDFLHAKEVPDWFRGNSEFQTKAVQSLWYSIRDDIAQDTTYRTHANLAAMGLKPMISNKQVKKLLNICRGSDIFLLWSLKEIFYKSPKPNAFNVNEQLIMSAIVRLDMITTLRGLDKILPPPQPTKAEIRKKQLEDIRIKKEALKKCRTEKAALRKNVRDPYGKKEIKSPYFVKLPRPKPKKLILYSDPPPYQIKLGHYESFKNKYFRVVNEQSRWFADYKLQPGKRLAKGIIEEQIANICNSFETVSLKANTVQLLCEHHKELKELEESLRLKMQALIQEKFDAYFDTNAKKKAALAECMRAKMENDQTAFLCKFRRLAEETRKQYTILVLKNDVDYECRCVELDSEDRVNCIQLPDCPPCPKRIYDEDVLEESDKEKENTRDENNNEKNVIAQPTNLKANNKSKRKVGSKTSNNASLVSDRQSSTNFNEKDLNYKAAKEKNRLRTNSPSDEYVAAYDFGGCPERKSPTSSNKFFSAPNFHCPHIFDYRKIFKFKDNNPSTLNIRKTFVEALCNDIDKLIQLQEEKEKPSPLRKSKLLDWEQNEVKRLGEWEKPNVDMAVKDCAKQMFLQGAKKKGKEIAEEMAKEKKREELKLAGKQSLGTIFREKFNQEYYDPDDKPLMHEMLKYALELLAQDPKYILAALPDADKLPFFREYIYLRYGKTYSKKERFESYRDTVELLRTIQKNSLKMRGPNEKDMGSSSVATYKCEKYYRRKGMALKKRFSEDFDEAIMDEARLLWFAMRPYLCGRPPRKTFFAYMPASKNLITRYKVWNPREFIDARKEFERRMAKTQGRELK